MSYFTRFVKRFLNKHRASTPRRIAKERLEQVLVQDRLVIDAQYIDEIKIDVLQTLSKHLELDESGAEVYITTDGDTVSFNASVPVRKLRREKQNCYDMVKMNV